MAALFFLCRIAGHTTTWVVRGCSRQGGVCSKSAIRTDRKRPPVGAACYSSRSITSTSSRLERIMVTSVHQSNPSPDAFINATGAPAFCVCTVSQRAPTPPVRAKLNCTRRSLKGTRYDQEEDQEEREPRRRTPTTFTGATAYGGSATTKLARKYGAAWTRAA